MEYYTAKYTAKYTVFSQDTMKKKKIFAVTENFNTAALAPPPAKRFLAFNKREYTPAMIYNMFKVHLCLNKWPEMTGRYTDCC